MPKYELVAVKQLRNDKFQDGIAIVYYEDGVKKVKFTNKPTIKFFTTKLDKIQDYWGMAPITMPLSDVEECECPYSEIFDEIVRLQADYDPEEAEKNFNYLNACRRNRTSPENLLLLNHTHGIDINLEDHYFHRFLSKYEKDLEIKNIRKGYFDIETNNRAVRDFVKGKDHTTPVNAISFYDAATHTIVLRLLDNSGPQSQYIEFNPQIEDFKAHLEEHRVFIENKINEQQHKLFEKAPIPDAHLEIKMYSDEVQMITDHYMDLKKRFHTDYLMAWNQEFDINFTFGRLKDLRSYEYLCDTVSADEIPVDFRDAYYIGDEHAKDLSKKNDRHRISSPWECIDMQYVYLKIRESMKKPEEYSLDYAMEKELGIHKVQHDCDMADYAYEDFAEFALYSAFDTMGLFWLDTKTSDIDTMVMLSNLSHTRIDKSMTKTVMLRNLIDDFYKKYLGLVISNNRTKVNNSLIKQAAAKGKKLDPYPELKPYKSSNERADALVSVLNVLEAAEDDDDEEESLVDAVQDKKVKFRGAFVADPKLMSPIGVEILGKASSLIFDLVADSDLSSLYPNLKIAWNIYITTLIGKIYPKADVSDINFSAELADYIVSRDNFAIGSKYLGLPDQEELLKIFAE